ncbi:MAG: quinone-dependent dihydroorotate dehydrogenase [Actinomycetaceae bacterium]|nr:quinone-dependent dihydroorotate dehydrogenase [Actinomycetaceae bacterium]
MYEWIFKHFISRTDPEQAHDVVMSALETCSRLPGAAATMRATFPRVEERLEADGFVPRMMRGKLGLAAGMDKNARAVPAFAAMGFSFVEVGTVTPRPQPGNDKPRLWRLPESKEIRNRMGFNNEGAEVVRQRLRKLRKTKAGRSLVIGVNIGKNKTTAADQAPQDYYRCARELADLADFLVINVSSPNTVGLRQLQTVESLEQIVTATKQGASEACSGKAKRVPILVKIAPDLEDDEIVNIAGLVNRLDVAGIVATNTTNQHEYGEGGVSGPRLLDRAEAVIRLLRKELDPSRTIIGVGGISSVEDAQRLLEAGADLLEGLTAFIYQGALWPSKINRGLRERGY